MYRRLPLRSWSDSMNVRVNELKKVRHSRLLPRPSGQGGGTAMLDILVSFCHAMGVWLANVDWELASKIVFFLRRTTIAVIQIRRALIADKAEKPNKKEKDA